MNFSLTFPEKWKNRYEIARDGQVVTVSIDEEATFSIAAFPNASGAASREKELLADGFSYYCENIDTIFFLRISGEVPDDLSLKQTGMVGLQTYTKCDINSLFSYTAESEDGYTSVGYPGDFADTHFLTSAQYCNYRLGFCLDFPDNWQGRFSISTLDKHVCVHLWNGKEFGPNASGPIFFSIVVCKKGEAPFMPEDKLILLDETEDYSYESANYTGAEYTLSSPISLLGALVEVPGSVGNYGHAVIITQENGDNRNQIYYTAHTNDAKNILFSDTYASVPIRIVLPTGMTEVVSCSGAPHTYSTVSSAYGQDATCNSCGNCSLYVKNFLSNCIASGSTITLTSYTGQKCYRMSMKVVAPDDTTTWLGETTNSSTYTRTYTFNQKGLYTITLYARDLDSTQYPSTSVQVYGTYTIRCY